MTWYSLKCLYDGPRLRCPFQCDVTPPACASLKPMTHDWNSCLMSQLLLAAIKTSKSVRPSLFNSFTMSFTMTSKTAQRIFVKFRTDQVPADRKDFAVATAACSKFLGRDFDFERDFLHAQGEILKDHSRCHILIDCDFRDSQPDLGCIDLVCYQVAPDKEMQL